MPDNSAKNKYMKQRESYIDMLKGIAILGVILTHYCMFFVCPNSIIAKISTIGARCPQLFFIISAYLTYKSLDKNSNISSITFYKKRFSKLLPLYFASLLLTLIIFPQKWEETNIPNILSHLFLINGFFPEYINSIMGIEWFVADLCIFYFCAPFIYKHIRSLKSSVILELVLVAINIAFIVFTNKLFYDEICSRNIYEMYFHTFCIVNQMPVFVMGIILFYLVQLLQSKGQKYYIVTAGCVGIGAILVLLLNIVFNLNKNYLTSSFVAGILFFELFLIINYIKAIANKSIILSQIGKVTLGMYLFHMMIIKVLHDYININCNNLLLWTIWLVVVLISAYGIGCISERYIISKSHTKY